MDLRPAPKAAKKRLCWEFEEKRGVPRGVLVKSAQRTRKSNEGRFHPRSKLKETTTPKGPNTSLEGVLGWFLGVKPVLRRYLDP